MRGVFTGGAERSQVEGSGLRWKGEFSGGGERSLVKGSGLRWRRAIAVGGERSRWRGAIAGGEELSLAEGSGLMWRGAILGGGERSQVEGSDRWSRGAVSGRGEQLQLEGTQGSGQTEGSDRWWRGAPGQHSLSPDHCSMPQALRPPAECVRCQCSQDGEGDSRSSRPHKSRHPNCLPIDTQLVPPGRGARPALTPTVLCLSIELLTLIFLY